MFPQKGVRFIAINNNVDSSNPVDNDFAPFLNIMNEWYAKDTSNKIRAVFRSRMQDGKRCSGSIPYGYVRKPGDKQTLYVDPEAAAVVKRIFEMTAEGMLCSKDQFEEMRSSCGKEVEKIGKRLERYVRENDSKDRRASRVHGANSER